MRLRVHPKTRKSHRRDAGATLVSGCTVIILLIAGCLVGAVGCGPQGETGKTIRGPLCFPSDGSRPQVWVYGGLQAALPQYDATPLIDRFLYGPSDYGKTGLRNPQGMALAGGRLLVCDQGYQNVVAIDLPTGKSMLWCDADHQPRCPVDVAADQDGRVYVADTTSRLVYVYDLNGMFIEDLAPTREAGGHFRPCAVRVDRGILYVGDLANRRIERYSLAERRWLEPLTPPADRGRLIAPTGLALAPDGVLLIADAVGGTVLRVTPEGRWLQPIGRPGQGPGEMVRPKQICCTDTGLVFVSDAARQSVLVFDQEGHWITEIHERAGEWSGWTLPMGLLAVRPDQLATAKKGDQARKGPQPSSYVIVSDSLGPESLTLLGVVVQDP